MRSKLNPVHRFASSSKLHTLDSTLLITVITLVIIGLILVYDSSVVQAFKDYGDKYAYIKKQLIWVLPGFGILAFFSFFDYHLLKRLSLPLFMFSVILLLLVLVPGLGIQVGGAYRWLNLGFVSIQPSEIAKLATIIFLAALFDRDKTGLSKRDKTTPFIIILGLLAVIVGILQKDLGSAMVLFFILIAMYAVSGAPLKIFLYLMPLSIITFITFVMSSPYRQHRVLAFLNPFADTEGYTYHISQVLIALGSGGLMGLGLGQSRQKYEYIPEVTTDSIFAIVGEEFGFIGGIILISLISFLVYRGFKTAEEARDNFGKMLAFGLTVWLGAQALVNLGAMVSLIPLTGVPLPFISYGGSALLANLMAVGILLNISKSSKNL